MPAAARSRRRRAVITHSGLKARLMAVTATTKRLSARLMIPCSTPTMDSRKENSPIWASMMPARKACCQDWPNALRIPTFRAVLNTVTRKNSISTAPRFAQM